MFSDARTTERMNLHGLLLVFIAFENRTKADLAFTSAAYVAAHETGPKVEVSGGLTRAQRALARPLDR